MRYGDYTPGPFWRDFGLVVVAGERYPAAVLSTTCWPRRRIAGALPGEVSAGHKGARACVMGPPEGPRGLPPKRGPPVRVAHALRALADDDSGGGTALAQPSPRRPRSRRRRRRRRTLGGVKRLGRGHGGNGRPPSFLSAAATRYRGRADRGDGTRHGRWQTRHFKRQVWGRSWMTGSSQHHLDSKL